jgi:hypothetical protein
MLPGKSCTHSGWAHARHLLACRLLVPVPVGRDHACCSVVSVPVFLAAAGHSSHLWPPTPPGLRALRAARCWLRCPRILRRCWQVLLVLLLPHLRPRCSALPAMVVAHEVASRAWGHLWPGWAAPMAGARQRGWCCTSSGATHHNAGRTTQWALMRPHGLPARAGRVLGRQRRACLALAEGIPQQRHARRMLAPQAPAQHLQHHPCPSTRTTGGRGSRSSWSSSTRLASLPFNHSAP